MWIRAGGGGGYPMWKIIKLYNIIIKSANVVYGGGVKKLIHKVGIKIHVFLNPSLKFCFFFMNSDLFCLFFIRSPTNCANAFRTSVYRHYINNIALCQCTQHQNLSCRMNGTLNF